METENVKLIYADDDTARVHCKKSNKDVSLTLKFETIKERDKFRQSWEPKNDIGSVGFEEPHDHIAKRQKRSTKTKNEDGAVDSNWGTIASKWGITRPEAIDAYDVAHDTFVAAQRARKRAR
ncbi:MAG: hypothetical protein RLZZ283_125 [Candidatus Parcubacteria bacterium]|jgi:hypothetical protein